VDININSGSPEWFARLDDVLRLISARHNDAVEAGLYQSELAGHLADLIRNADQEEALSRLANLIDALLAFASYALEMPKALWIAEGRDEAEFPLSRELIMDAIEKRLHDEAREAEDDGLA
jgi:hypothetical protein